MTILPKSKPANVAKSQSSSAGQQSGAQQQQSGIVSEQSSGTSGLNLVPFQQQAGAMGSSYAFNVSHTHASEQLTVGGAVSSVSSSASSSSTSSSSSSASASSSGVPSASVSATKRRHGSPSHRAAGICQRKRASTSAVVTSTASTSSQSALLSSNLPTSFANMTLPQSVVSGSPCGSLPAQNATPNVPIEPNANAATCSDRPTSPCNSEDEYFQEPEEENEEAERLFELAMRKKGFEIRQTRPDGACFFRAVAAQVFGDEEMHDQVRRHVCDYMLSNREHYAQFVAEDFGRYISRKRRPDCHANYLELQAVSELFNRPIEVYQYSVTPINVFHGHYETDNDAIRVSYHRKRHYNAVIDPFKATVGVGLGLPGLQPGQAERNLMNSAMKDSEDYHIEETMLKDKLRESDWERTERELYSQITRESYLQFVREVEQRRTTNAASSSASCSSASSSKSKPFGIRSPCHSGAASTSGVMASPRADASTSSSSLFQPPAAPDALFHPPLGEHSAPPPFANSSRRRPRTVKDHSVFSLPRTDSYSAAAQSDSDETASTCSDQSSHSASQQRAALRARRNSAQQQFASRTLAGIPEPGAAPSTPSDKTERDTVNKTVPAAARTNDAAAHAPAEEDDIEDLIFAQVLAQSEQEYFDVLRSRTPRLGSDAEACSTHGGPSTSKER